MTIQLGDIEYKRISLPYDKTCLGDGAIGTNKYLFNHTLVSMVWTPAKYEDPVVG